MRIVYLLVIISLMISCQGKKTSNNPQQNEKDSLVAQPQKSSEVSQKVESSIWAKIDKINKQLLQIQKDNSASVELEKHFQESLQIALSNELADEFDKMRNEAYNTNNFTTIEQYAKRCQPAINVFIMGESNNIGVNIESFIERFSTSTLEYRFFELAKDGFYFDSETCRLGTADFPVWIERTESSFQGELNIEKAKEQLAKWKSIQQELNGFYKSVAESTIACLEDRINRKTTN